MSRFALALMLAGCGGCGGLPFTLAPPGVEDARAIDATRDAWAQARDLPDCPELDAALVATVPHAELQKMCGHDGEVIGCLFDDPGHAVIAVSDRRVGEDRAETVAHETVHALRRCWVREDPYRLHAGETPECRIEHPADNDHCDADAWYAIKIDAVRRWSQR